MPKFFKYFCIVVFAFFAVFFNSAVFGQTTSFTYQGRLVEAGNLVSGSRLIRFTLYDESGVAIPNASVEKSVTVTNGIFSTTLDFGENTFSGANRSLEIAVKINSNDQFTVLSPRQNILSAPYAIKSKNAQNAVNAIQLNGVDSTRFIKTDNNGNVGIGTASNGSKLSVAGVIESTSGGIRFPDATVQTTAGLTSVARNSTLVGNGTSASPLGVAAPLNDNARQPVQARAFFNDDTGTLTLLTVPVGKKLVIEQITANLGSFDSTRKIISFAIGTTVSGSNINHYFVPTFTGRGQLRDLYIVGQQVKLYADAGTNVTALLEFTYDPSKPVAPHSGVVSISGYYYDVP
jgi:hypothetical protein